MEKCVEIKFNQLLSKLKQAKAMVEEDKESVEAMAILTRANAFFEWYTKNYWLNYPSSYFDSKEADYHAFVLRCIDRFDIANLAPEKEEDIGRNPLDVMMEIINDVLVLDDAYNRHTFDKEMIELRRTCERARLDMLL